MGNDMDQVIDPAPFVDPVPPWGTPGHGAAIGELGMRYEYEGDALVGIGEITRHMFVPGTTVVRTSVLATWADFVTARCRAQRFALESASPSTSICT